MENHFQKITENLYGFLLWDESWNSYNNCYVLIEGNEIILIDSGKKEHFEQLETAIKSVGFDKGDISKFIATHGHKDHIGGIQFLEKIEGYIHQDDIELLPEVLKSKLQTTLPDIGTTISGLECVKLGHHTKGSVLLYHSNSKALFCGDHICFFGEPLNDNKVVEEAGLNRVSVKKFVADWSQSEEMKKQHNFGLFIKGLREINKFDIEYLCTGHGVILQGGINEFIADLIDAE